MLTNHFPSPDLHARPLAEQPAHAPETGGPGHWVLLGESVAIRRLRSQVERIAPYFRTALIVGETGTGRQLVARALHARSTGAQRPFVAVDAMSLTDDEDLKASRDSKVEAVLASARGGTLYIQGAGELSFAKQATLMRFFDYWEHRSGRIQEPSRDFRQTKFQEQSSVQNGRRPLEVRIVVGTGRDLRTLAAIGQYRQELYDRLAAVELVVPPLRERVGDIAVLAEWFLGRMAAEHGPKVLTEETLAQLERRSWPGNLSELRRVLAHAAALSDDPRLEPRHLMSLVEHSGPTVAAVPARVQRLDEVIQHHVLHVLTRCAGNKLRAAEMLGISRSTLYRMLDAAAPSNNVTPE